MAKAKPNDTPLLEWVMGALGAALFCAILAVVVINGASGGDEPPDIRTQVRSVAPSSGGYVIEFSIVNAGDRTAADVEVIAQNAAGETATAHFDYLPPHSSRRGGVFFKSDPRSTPVSFLPSGYSDP